MVKRIKVTQKKPVSWLAPKGLVQTAIKAMQAALFGAYADRRETIAALSPHETDSDTKPISYANERELWFDYIADTGDGWDATYAIACLVGEDTLDVAGADRRLKRGAFTILGGDEVYPTATREDYQERLIDPFWCAHATDDEPPKVYALPGNHDWYDGLTSFMRLFLQLDRKIGPWQAHQRRTYFAIELPHNWWIWGVDVQLESDIDAPQVEYFKHYADKLTRSDRVILCTPEPSWVEGADDKYRKLKNIKIKTHENLVFLEDLIHKAGAKIPLRIAGDLHHYARYEGRDRKDQLITCGGGGAFLHSTHPLPDSVNLISTFGQWFDKKVVSPSAAWCKQQRKKVFLRIWDNHGFAVAVAAIYAFYAWVLEAASEGLVDYPAPHLSLFDYFAQKSDCPIVPWSRVTSHSLFALLLTLAIVIGPAVYGIKMKRFATSSTWPVIGGLLHGAAHLFTAIYLMWLFSSWGSYHFLFGLVPIFFLGLFFGTFYMALYLYLANLLYDGHDEEVFSCQAITGYKCFARFHLTRKGLTLYPIGLATVPKAWRPAEVALGLPPQKIRGELTYDLSAPDNLKRIFEPDPPGALQPRLIEPPIKIG